MVESVPVTADLLRGWSLPDAGADPPSRGRVLVVGGSATTPGAVLLAAEAALRAGAGKLTVATSASVAPQVAVLLPEAQVHPLAETRGGDIDPGQAARLLELAGSGHTLVAGPGFIDPRASVALLAGLLPHLDGTVVLDALATAFVTERPERLRELPGSFILTMNPGELGAALRRGGGTSRDPAADTGELAGRTGAVVLCGGAQTVVADGHGGRWRLDVGGPGLGVPGSGDVRAGIVTGLAASRAGHAQAAVWGGFLHGRAGERLAARVGAVGFLARELPGEVPPLLAELSGKPGTDAPGAATVVDALVAGARSHLDRVGVADLAAERAAGALVVDIRPLEQRRRDGELPGALVVDRNVLEWRLDPTCPHHLPEATDPERRVIVVCNEGYSSSLAAATLRQLGLRRATDLVGGFQAWREAAR